MMEFAIPHGAEREYLIVFEVAAVFIGTCQIGEPCIVGATRDLNLKRQGRRDACLRRNLQRCADIDESMSHTANGPLENASDGGMCGKFVKTMTPTWYVTCEVRKRGILPKQRSPRETRTFASEIEAKTFARSKLEEGLAVFAGTINPHSPRRIVPASCIHDWLVEPVEADAMRGTMLPVGSPDSAKSR